MEDETRQANIRANDVYHAHLARLLLSEPAVHEREGLFRHTSMFRKRFEISISLEMALVKSEQVH